MLDFIGKWRDKIADYIDTRVNLAKLNIIEQVSKVLSHLAFMIACFMFILPILLFLSIGTAEVLADAVGSRAGGYYIITGFYLLVFLVLYLSRKSIIRALMSMFIKAMTDNDDDDEKQDKNKTAL